MIGTITSNKMTKAIGVTVYTTKIHKKYGKRFKIRKKYSVACEDSSTFKIGETVKIKECAPVSKTISFRVVVEN